MDIPEKELNALTHLFISVGRYQQPKVNSNDNLSKSYLGLKGKCFFIKYTCSKKRMRLQHPKLKRKVLFSLTADL